MTPSQHKLLASTREAMPAILEGNDRPPVGTRGERYSRYEWDRPPLEDPPENLEFYATAETLLAEGFMCEAILSTICKVAELTSKELRGRQRARHIVRARQVACFLMSRLSTRSLMEIGRFINRDHTTVMHAIQTVRKKLDEGDELTCTIHRNVKRELGV